MTLSHSLFRAVINREANTTPCKENAHNNHGTETNTPTLVAKQTRQTTTTPEPKEPSRTARQLETEQHGTILFGTEEAKQSRALSVVTMMKTVWNIEWWMMGKFCLSRDVRSTGWTKKPHVRQDSLLFGFSSLGCFASSSHHPVRPSVFPNFRRDSRAHITAVARHERDYRERERKGERERERQRGTW